MALAQGVGCAAEQNALDEHLDHPEEPESGAHHPTACEQTDEDAGKCADGVKELYSGFECPDMTLGSLEIS